MAVFKVIPLTFVSVLVGAVISGSLGVDELLNSSVQEVDISHDSLFLNVTPSITSPVKQLPPSSAPVKPVAKSPQSQSYSNKVDASLYKYRVTFGSRSYTGHGVCNIYKIKGFAFESGGTLSFDDYEFTNDKSFLGSQPIWCAPSKYFYIFEIGGTWVVKESKQSKPQQQIS